MEPLLVSDYLDGYWLVCLVIITLRDYKYNWSLCVMIQGIPYSGCPFIQGVPLFRVPLYSGRPFIKGVRVSLYLHCTLIVYFSLLFSI